MEMYNNSDITDKVVPGESRNNTVDLQKQIKRLQENLELLTRKLDNANRKISRFENRVRQLETDLINIKRNR